MSGFNLPPCKVRTQMMDKDPPRAQNKRPDMQSPGFRHVTCTLSRSPAVHGCEESSCTQRLAGLIQRVLSLRLPLPWTVPWAKFGTCLGSAAREKEASRMLWRSVEFSGCCSDHRSVAGFRKEIPCSTLSRHWLDCQRTVFVGSKSRSLLF